MALRYMVRLASWIVGDTSKEGLVSGTLIVVGGILDWVILHAVVLRVVKRLCTSFSTW